MATLVNFEIKPQPGIILAGKEIRYSEEEQMRGENRLPGFWDECFKNNIFVPLEADRAQVYSPDYVGVMIDWDKGDGNFSYIVGMLMKEGARIPEGYFARSLPETEVAIGYIKGANTGDVCSVAHILTEEALKARGRSCKNLTWCMELYNCPRFTTPAEDGSIILDYYIPLDFQ